MSLLLWVLGWMICSAVGFRLGWEIARMGCPPGQMDEVAKWPALGEIGLGLGQRHWAHVPPFHAPPWGSDGPKPAPFDEAMRGVHLHMLGRPAKGVGSAPRGEDLK